MSGDAPQAAETEERLRRLLALLEAERARGGALPAEAIPGGALPGEELPGEALPAEAIPGGAPVDLRTVLGEIAALRGAVRASVEAHREQRDRQEASLEALQRAEQRASERAALAEASLARERQERARAARRARRRVARALLDLADRLEPAVAQARALGEAEAGLMGAARRVARRLGLAADPRAHAEGLALTWERLGQHLERLSITALAAVGRPFDPTCMEAVGQVRRGDRPDGEVVEEIRRGYRDADGVLRPAQVVVSRARPTTPTTPTRPA